jgi:hypothetical protein
MRFEYGAIIKLEACDEEGRGSGASGISESQRSNEEER